MQTAEQEIRGLLNQIRALTNNPAVDRASDQIEVLCRAYMEPDQLPIAPGSHMEPNQARIFHLLSSRRGAAVSKDAILDVMAHRTQDGPTGNCISVYICELRKRLLGTEYEGKIQTVHGIGYRLAA